MRILKIICFWFFIAAITIPTLLISANILIVPSRYNGLFVLLAAIITTIITIKNLKDGFFG
jgi:hypothetical protein